MERVESTSSSRVCSWTTSTWYLFKLFVLSILVCWFCNSADSNSFIKRLEHDRFFAIEWFVGKNMKLNQVKCHLLISIYKNENVWANIGNEKVWESNKQKFLDLNIDRNLNFNEYVFSLCTKVGNKRSVLPKMSNFMSFK